MTAKHSDAASGSSAYPVRVITDARPGASQDLARRQRRYLITMSFRTACFISMIFVPGWFRWVLLGAAVFLPYVAVLFANQADRKGSTPPRAQEPIGPVEAPALTSGDEGIIPGETSKDERDSAVDSDRRGDAGPQHRVA